ncbi:TIGR03643 family protein [bacterium]|nr:TIGR03643 family protein [bacterium]MBT4250351.1 TIGR03643 family protein [bacterium]MBT4927797.1 TIGR03643 family protein [bacterium]MBT5733282.1 TIGR03643 family protein [bacterium]MBT6017772.1 TIGR03643 family protein [bacterium]
MAWEDRTTFDAIKDQYGISEPDVITLMRKNLKRNSFKLWRERVSGRKTKHRASSQTKTPRFKSYNQK